MPIVEKLVRDNIKDIIEAEGLDTSHIRIESDSKRIRELVAAKVLEEAQEVSEALLSGSKDELIEELADLHQVMIKIEDIEELDERDLLDVMIKKGIHKGIFNKNYVMRLK